MDRSTPDVVLRATRPLYGDTRGFPLNLDVYNIPATTNYPPLSQNPEASTAPLVSVPGDMTHRPMFLADRKLIAGVVDPMTGQPLIREVDLELPLGRATYRMIRTYGGNVDGGGDGLDDSAGEKPRFVQGRYWDWAGTGWMMSENPILLVDAQYIQHEPSRPRVCYLILDAHHSIPFTQDPDTGAYAAPAWFDATFAITTANAAGERTATVKLYGESVTYTFAVTGADIVKLPTTQNALSGPRDAHASPRVDSSNGQLEVHEPGSEGGGLGIPHVGLLKKIEDRFGNRVEFEHCSSTPFAVPPPSGDCQSCVQACAEKGQIKTARLYTAGSTQPVWTMLYVHRSFRAWAPDMANAGCLDANGDPVPGTDRLQVSTVDEYSKCFFQNAVHAVYVYEGTPQGMASTGPSWTLPADAFIEGPNGQGWAQTLDEQDVEGWTEEVVESKLGWIVPAGWKYRMRYMYDETILPARCTGSGAINTVNGVATRFGALSEVPGIFRWGTPLSTAQDGTWIGAPRTTPCLLRVEKTTRAATQIVGDGIRTYTAYMYSTRSDEPVALLPTEVTNANTEHSAVAEDRSTANVDGHSSRWGITPKLKHVIRHDRLMSVVKDLSAASVNCVFDPTDAVGQVANNRKSYANRANLSFDWQKTLRTSINVPTWTKPWLMQEVIGECALSQVELARVVLRAELSSVARVRVSDSSSYDGTFDVLYMMVNPKGGVFASASDWVAAQQILNGSGGGPRVQSGQGVANITSYSLDRLPDSYTLFPFNLRRLAIGEHFSTQSTNVSLLPSCPMDQPQFIALVDRHDGWSSASKPENRQPYVMRYLINAGNHGSTVLPQDMLSGEKIMRPHQREVVGLNAAGFVLFERQWDYQTGGVSAVGPTEEFIYIPITRVINRSDGVITSGGPDDANGQPTDDPLDEYTRVLTGMLLTEHRSLGWGVGYVHDVPIASCGIGAGCTTSTGGECWTSSRGLITKYDYYRTPAGEQTSLIERIRIQEGLSGQSKKISELSYDAATKQVVRDQRFTLDGSGSEVPSMSTYRLVEYQDAGQNAPKRIAREVVWRDKAKMSPNGPELSPFEAKFYNEKGLLVARAYGLHPDPGNQPLTDAAAGSGATVFVDVYGYDENGRRLFEIIDANIRPQGDQGTAGSLSVTDPLCRPDWHHIVRDGQPLLPTATQIASAIGTLHEKVTRQIPSDVGHLLPALNRTTGYAHGYEDAIEIVAKPGGRFDFFIQQIASPSDCSSPPPTAPSEFRLTRVYTNGIIVPGASGGSMNIDFASAGQVATIADGRPIRTWTVSWDTAPMSSVPVSGSLIIDVCRQWFERSTTLDKIPLAGCSVIAELQPEYDENGRPTKVRSQGLPQGNVAATEELEQEAIYTDFGLVSKRVTPSGVVHRSVTSPVGQTLAEYKGTKDMSSCWFPGMSGGTDNLVLTAKHIYGEGIKNIRKPVLTRRYRNGVGCDQTDFHSRGGPATDTTSSFLSETTGWEEAYGYDRRGRLCATEVYGEARSSVGDLGRPSGAADGAYHGEALTNSAARPLLRAEYTWHDHQDRPRFFATYAPASAVALRAGTSAYAVDSSVNPRVRDVYKRGDPTASDLLGTSPLRLTETIYNKRGLVEEVREYDTQNSSGLGTLAHQVTRTYYGHGDLATLRLSSSGRWERTTYDALGRVVATSVLRGDIAGATGANAYEIERTDLHYNIDGRVDRTSQTVRTKVDSNDILTVSGASANAVRTDTLTWFDDAGRPVATASVGTASGATPNAMSETFVNAGSGPFPAPSQSGTAATPPAWVNGGWTRPGLPSHAIISTITYDDLGRVKDTRAPSGIVTQKVYDGLNRVIRERVMTNPDSLATMQTETAYQYSRGKLVKIAAIRPGYLDNGGTSGAYTGVVNFNPSGSDSRIQITELVYGDRASGRSANIIDPTTGGVVSADYDLLMGIRFPSGTCTCNANVNGDYGVTVQDIFDFLNAWFLGCSASPCTSCSACPGCCPSGTFITADFNSENGISPQDIFDFLNCWFLAGSCDRQWLTSANPLPGSAGQGADIVFEYTLDGLIAARSDLARTHDPSGAPRTKVAHVYDELGRRIQTRVLEGGVDVADSIERATFAYDELDRLVSATAEARDRSVNGGCFYPVATNLFTHDSFGNLTGEKLLHGDTNVALVNPLRYQWEYAVGAMDPPGGAAKPIVARLKSMTLPWASGNDGLAAAHRRMLTYDYGEAFSSSTDLSRWLDNAMHRVRSIGTGVGVTNAGGADVPIGPVAAIADYNYIGESRRAGVFFGRYGTSHAESVFAQSFINPAQPGAATSGPDVAGLDTFGRIRTLGYVRLAGGLGGGGDVQVQREYRYDAHGNIETIRATQVSTAGPTGDGQSWRYTHDKRGRLTGAERVTLDASWNDERIASETIWRLDDLGNWSRGSGLTFEGAAVTHVELDENGDPLSEIGRRHGVDVRNQIARIVVSANQGVHPNATQDPTHERIWHSDAAERLMYDGDFLYEHDAFGRLVQVRSASGLMFNSAGQQGSGGSVGALRLHYTYDALGRVVRVQKPSDEASTPAQGATLQVTDLYFDGVRVVQEVGYSGVPVRVVVTAEGVPKPEAHGLPRRANEMIGNGATQPPAAPPGVVPSCGLPASSNWLWSSRRLTREYVWAADPSGYVDECVAQYVYTGSHTPISSGPRADAVGNDTSATLLYVLTDHNANVIALADSEGDVAAQYGYTAYGRVRSVQYAPLGMATGPPTPPDVSGPSLTSAEELLAARGNPLGHQGLRFERFDRPWDGVLDLTTAVPVDPNSTRWYELTTYAGLYFNRNRMYDAETGRFTSRDPNGLGGVVLGSMAYGGMSIHVPEISHGVVAHFGDGLNTHVAYGQNPSRRQDPNGLIIMGPLDTAMAGLEIGEAAARMMMSYSINLMDNVDWAADWGADDFEPFRVRGGGLAHDDLINDEDVDDDSSEVGDAGPAMASSTMGATAAVRTTVRFAKLQRLRMVMRLVDAKVVFKNYAEARILTKGLGRRIQVHHIVERRFAGLFGTNASDLPAIMMTRRQHERITARIFRQLPTNPQRNYTRDEVVRAYQNIYRDHPEMLSAVESLLTGGVR